MTVVQFLASKGRGGLESIFSDLCLALSAHVKLHVIVFKDSDVLSTLDNRVQIHLLSSYSSRFNPLLYFELFLLLKKIKPDLVHTHGAKATEIMYHLSQILFFKQIATKHNARKGNIFNKIKYVTAVSMDVAKSIASDHVKIVYNGLMLQAIPKGKITHKRFTILAVGRLDKIKGFDILIKECAKLEFDFLLQIIGEGEEKISLQSLIDDFGLNEKVKLLGFRKDIPLMMHNSDVVVLSSHSEGFSLVMIEALFYANSFISTRVSGATEILDSQFLINGWDVAEKIKDVYLNYDLYKSDFMHLKKKLQKKFLLQNIIEQYLNIYQKVLHEKKFK
ncbi:MAG TPA: lipopolysaccharide biosynthesis protein [Sulfurovum sp. UBA12169]|nr:MAG TPA: lipopolysaccharide biosynthesis protein [Sulfurovum sp. UBA12169]